MSFQLYGDRLTLDSHASSSRHPTSSYSSEQSQHGQSHSVSRNVPIIIDSDEDEVAAVPVASKSRTAGNGVRREQSAARHRDDGGGDLDMEAKEALRVALSKLDAEIKSVQEQLRPLQELHASLISERRALENQSSQASRSHAVHNAGSSTKGSISTNQIDYQTSSFPFTVAILQTLKSTFHLSSFRLCQEGVINAAVDERDIVCVMPTGGGKSLTYQLPAVMGRGLTVVISPLLALIWDQVRAMKEIGIECVMMTGATSTSEQNEIYERMKTGGTKHKKEIRLCYVTPEKVSKAKRLISTLEQVNQEGRLRRFVIDEAHCCSQLGHDFRPDYKKLSMLKTLFPRVPIQAVTATLSSKTLPDLLKILRLGAITDGRAAKTTGTVFFSAPLFRPNLHYKVLPKPSNAKSAIAAMGNWIQTNHAGESGIIYCLSKKDAETVADELRQWSGGNVKTGVYHAGIDDSEKERIHVRWREGKVNCICATIAFGLGIDKGDVRYVIHHSMSKSLEGYYQETGRAGRDGQDSDCVLFYRGQDAARLSSLIYGDVDGSSKLQEMLRFAQDLRTCRKVAFARYFSASAHLSASAWDHADSLSSSSGAVTTCGICDNCRRPPESIVTRDVTLETWKILKVSEEVQREGGRVTLANLADLVRGLGGGLFGVVGGGEGKRGKRKMTGDKGQVDLAEVGGKVTLSKDDTESLMMHLILLGYLADSYHATAYSVNVYVIPGEQAIRLSRLSMDDIMAGNGLKIECTLPAPDPKRSKGTSKGKGKGRKSAADDDDEDGEGDEGDDNDSGREDEKVDKKISKARKGASNGKAKAKLETADWFDLPASASESELPESEKSSNKRAKAVPKAKSKAVKIPAVTKPSARGKGKDKAPPVKRGSGSGLPVTGRQDDQEQYDDPGLYMDAEQEEGKGQIDYDEYGGGLDDSEDDADWKAVLGPAGKDGLFGKNASSARRGAERNLSSRHGVEGRGSSQRVVCVSDSE